MSYRDFSNFTFSSTFIWFSLDKRNIVLVKNGTKLKPKKRLESGEISLGQHFNTLASIVVLRKYMVVPRFRFCLIGTTHFLEAQMTVRRGTIERMSYQRVLTRPRHSVQATVASRNCRVASGTASTLEK